MGWAGQKMWGGSPEWVLSWATLPRPPPGSFFCRTLGGGCSSWLKPSTTSGVSSRSTLSRMRHPTSGGERGCMKGLRGSVGAPIALHLPDSAAFPGSQETLSVQRSHRWQLGLLGSHHCAGPWLHRPRAPSGPWPSLPSVASVQLWLSLPTSHFAFNRVADWALTTIFFLQGWAPPV